MQQHEYRMISLRPLAEKQELKGKSRAEKAAEYLEELVGAQASGGWEFYRIDTFVIREYETGCLVAGGDKVTGASQAYVATFRRPKQ